MAQHLRSIAQFRHHTFFTRLVRCASVEAQGEACARSCCRCSAHMGKETVTCMPTTLFTATHVLTAAAAGLPPALASVSGGRVEMMSGVVEAQNAARKSRQGQGREKRLPATKSDVRGGNNSIFFLNTRHAKRAEHNAMHYDSIAYSVGIDLVLSLISSWILHVLAQESHLHPRGTSQPDYCRSPGNQTLRRIVIVSLHMLSLPPAMQSAVSRNMSTTAYPTRTMPAHQPSLHGGKAVRGTV
jgi:hypothetical protein